MRVRFAFAAVRSPGGYGSAAAHLYPRTGRKKISYDQIRILLTHNAGRVGGPAENLTGVRNQGSGNKGSAEIMA